MSASFRCWHLFCDDKLAKTIKIMNENNENIEEMKSETLEEPQANENTENNATAEAPADENAETAENAETQAEEEAPAEPTVEEQLAAANATIEELKKAALYKAAEFDNYRKHVIKEKADLIKTGGANVMKAILPIIDDFERAEQMMDKSEDVNAVKEGVTLIIDKFLKLLATEGLKKIDCIGKEFDTDYHEAIAMVPGQPAEMQNKVIDCVQAGYMMGDKVIRYSKVAVAKDNN